MPSRTILPAGEYDNLVKDDHGLGKLFRDQARLNPTAIAVVEGDHSLSYAELHAKALRLALQLREETYDLEEPTGILVNPGANDIVTQIAVIYAGGTCVTLDPALSDQQIESRLGKIGSRHILVDAANEARVATLRQIVVDDHVPTNEEPSAIYDNIIETTLDHRTHLIHTSGTTSEPKAVQISGRSILQVAYHAPFIPLDATDSVAHVNNTSFDVSLFDIWATLLRGARIVVLAKNVLLDPIVLAENLEHYQVTVMATTTALLNLAAITCPSAFSRLKICFIGGEAANPRTIKTVLESKPPKNLINAYGPTECCIFALAHKIVLEDTKQDSVSIGKPIGNTSIYILDDSLVPVRGEEAGELFIGGAGVSRGYLNHPEKTAKSFLEIGGLTPTGEPIRLYRTGDVVRRDKAGAIHYVGRRDHQVKIRGFRIELEAVESALLKTGHFHAATALRIESPQEGAGGILVAYAVPNASMKDPLVGVAETLKILLPDYMVPRIELIDSLPLNTHDKVDRKKLTSLYLERWKARLAAAKAEGVGTTTLSRLEQLWVDVLASNISHCGPNDDFFLLGGTSLQAAVLIHQIRQNFSVEISSLTLYENTTLSALASVIDQSKDVGKSKAIKDESEIWIADSRLADRLVPPTGQPQDWRHITEGRVMLTGVTGFVGAFFLHQLLQLPEVQQVGCLVRASDTTMALLRIRQSLEKYNLWRESFLRKILPLPGNLEDENLGLGKDRFEELAEWASVVFHLGAHVNYTQPYSMHRPANTLGTLHMLRFLSVGRPKALHYVSSISCFGPTGFFTGTTRVPEDTILFPHLKALPYDHGYAQSQWVAEQMLWNSMDRGFPIAIYRPGFITGHSVTGVSNPDDFFSRLMVACLELGSYPMLPNQRKEFVTVDYVNSAILHMATNRNLGHAYHIVPRNRGASVDMNETFRLAACNGFPELQELAYNEWIDALAASDNKTLKPLLPMLEEKIHNGLTRWELYEHMPVYETDNTDKALADYPGGLDCPVLDEKLMGKYLQNWNAASMSSGRSSSVSESSSSEPESSLATPQSENSSIESASVKKYQETAQVIVVEC